MTALQVNYRVDSNNCEMYPTRVILHDKQFAIENCTKESMATFSFIFNGFNFVNTYYRAVPSLVIMSNPVFWIYFAFLHCILFIYKLHSNDFHLLEAVNMNITSFTGRTRGAAVSILYQRTRQKGRSKRTSTSSPAVAECFCRTSWCQFRCRLDSIFPEHVLQLLRWRNWRIVSVLKILNWVLDKIFFIFY